MPKGKKRIMRKLSIFEISGVDVPAQKGARALLFKRDERKDVRKDGVVYAATGVSEGHQHGISFWVNDGQVHIYLDSASSKDDDSWHSHSLLRSSEGVYTVLQSSGHTHDLDNDALSEAISAFVLKRDPPSAGGPDMDEDKLAELQKAIQEMQEHQKRLQSIVDMSVEERTYFDALGSEDQTAHLAKSDEDRAKAYAKKEDEDKDQDNPVVYKTKAGLSIRKEDGDTVLALAKMQDESTKKLQSMEEENASLRALTKDAEYRKRAEEELTFLPGTVEARASMLKAIDGIESEEERKSALEGLKANNESLKSAFSNYGAGSVSSGIHVIKSGESSAKSELDKLTDDYLKDHKDLDFAQAQVAVLETPEGSVLYNKMLAEEANTSSAR